MESLKEIIIEEKPEVIGLVETMLDGKDKLVMEGTQYTEMIEMEMEE